PVELAVQLPAAREAGQRRHDHAAALGELVEERRPLLETAEAGQIAERRALPFLPDAHVLALDADGALADSGRRHRTTTARGSLRSSRGSGLGHQWFSHSFSNRPLICGATRFANSSVL